MSDRDCEKAETRDEVRVHLYVSQTHVGVLFGKCLYIISIIDHG